MTPTSISCRQLSQLDNQELQKPFAFLHQLPVVVPRCNIWICCWVGSGFKSLAALVAMGEVAQSWMHLIAGIDCRPAVFNASPVAPAFG